MSGTPETDNLLPYFLLFLTGFLKALDFRYRTVALNSHQIRMRNDALCKVSDFTGGAVAPEKSYHIGLRKYLLNLIRCRTTEGID